MAKGIFHGSIQKKLTLIVLLATLPAFMGHLWAETSARWEAIEAAKKETSVILRGFSEIQRRISGSTRTLLQTIVAVPEVRDLNVDKTKILLSTLLEANPIYTNVILLNLQGDVLVAGKGNPKGMNFSDRKQFQNAIETKKFASGEFVVGKVTRKAIFPFAMPILNLDGKPKGAIIVGVDLSHYGKFFESGYFPKDSFFGMCDYRGNRLFRYPIKPNISLGKPIKDTVFNTASSSKKTGTLVSAGSDNLTRIIAYEPLFLDSETEPYMYMFMGFDRNKVLARADSLLIRGLLTTAVSLCLALIIAWVLGGRSIAKSLEKLTNVVQKLGKEDVKSPSGIDYSDGEIGRLGQAFDVMIKLLRLREGERNQALYRLSENEEQSRILLDSNPSGICLINPENWLIEFVNPAFMSLFELRPEDLGGLCLNELHPTKEFRGIKTEYQKHFAKEISYSPAIQCLSHSGRSMVIDISSAVVTIQGRELLAGFFTDITERKQTEAYIIQAEKMMSVGGLAAGMAHEINNPLSAIVGSAQNLHNRILTDSAKNRKTAELCGISLDKVHEYLDVREAPKMINTINESVQRAADIVSKMLGFSRKSDCQACDHNIEALLDTTLDLAASDYDLKKNYDFRKVAIVRNYEVNLHPVFCDSTQIQQVFLNIIKNAAEAMVDKKYENEKPQITLRVREEDGMAVVEIEDNGPGIAEDIATHIFEPFYTTKPVGKGTGLGLSVSYFIITDQHNGQMFVQSLPGEWTRFIVKLPFMNGLKANT
ncbi:ATP-binding protein [Maridesulfovibrio frigidus]|uniref:ATP-binding protein n=1 Tax=Maridesulfovibrio frigidus TaxID=340956 RepID=UPI00069090B7|nr:ATP-binding protein [Maridesulfovibrio frigidus]